MTSGGSAKQNLWNSHSRNAISNDGQSKQFFLVLYELRRNEVFPRKNAAKEGFQDFIWLVT